MKIAVLGTGSIGMRHLGVLRDLGAEVLAVPVRPERRSGLQAAGFVCIQHLREARDLGAKAAVVATNTCRHISDASEALDLGFSVLVEKPLASTADEARTFVKRVRTSERLGFVACCLRFDAGIRRLRDRLPEVGAIHSVRAECRSYLPEWRPGQNYLESYSARLGEGGVLRDLIHEVDYTLWIFGPPQLVFGRLRNVGRLGIAGEEAADALWEAPGGVRVSLELDYLSRDPVRFLRVAGDRGELILDIMGRRLVCVRADGAHEEEIIGGDRLSMYTAQAESFLRAAEGGRPGDLATMDDGLTALAICDALRISSEVGRVIRVQS